MFGGVGGSIGKGRREGVGAGDKVMRVRARGGLGEGRGQGRDKDGDMWRSPWKSGGERRGKV